MFRILVACLILPCLGFGKINDQLELLFEIQGGDSVISITQTGSGKISVLVVDSTGTQERTLESEVPSHMLGKLKESAESESIPWKVTDFQLAPAPVPAAAPENQDALGKNKFRYVSTQTTFSTYIYGFALPIALEAPDKAAAMTLLALPISFGAHYYVAWNKDYHDSHLLATSYFASNSLIFSYALPFMVLGPDYNAFRIGNFAALAAYPLGLHYGYKHGTRFQDEPGRISLQSSFASTMGIMGFFGVSLWANMIESGEIGTRLLVAQTLGAAVGGHYLSYKYRTHERVPGGIGPGISTFSLLGGMVAGSLVASIEPESGPAFGSIMLAGIGAGFWSGQKFFQDKYDTFERAGYNTLGLSAGALTPLGLMLLTESFPDGPAPLFWTVTSGAFAGYFLTRAITSSLVEEPRRIGSQKGFIKNFAFNPIPMPVMETRDGRRSVNFVAQVFSATF